jgi:hypothetical protein
LLKVRTGLRRYIFTENELEIINTFLETGVRLSGFNQLRFRIREHWPKICGDMTVAMQFVAEFHEGFRVYAEECKNFQELLKDYQWSDFLSEEEP